MTAKVAPSPDRSTYSPARIGSPPPSPIRSEPPVALYSTYYDLASTYSCKELRNRLTGNPMEEFLQIKRITCQVLADTARPGVASPYTMFEGMFCKRFNRYSDVVPYDRNFVKILGERYINASHIEAVGKHYIACQAPVLESAKTENTMGHHWQMIWEQKSNVIVMLTKFIEGVVEKAVRYWPETVGETSQFDDVLVTLTAQETVMLSPEANEGEASSSESSSLGRVQKSTLTIKHLREAGERVVTHFHFEDWPDNQKTSPAVLNALIEKTEEIELSGPLVVHCSAGIGRAGTYIALDSLLREIRSIQRDGLDDRISVMRRVLELRHQRDGSVFTSAQYRLLYESLSLALRDAKV